MWARDPTCGEVITKAWRRGMQQTDMNQIMTKIKTTKVSLKSWNQHHFGNIHMKAAELKNYIETLQALPQLDLVLEMEGAAQLELDEIWTRERLLWKAKAKAKWIAEGDANTRFFHISTITHRKYNYIHTMITANDARVYDSN